MKRTLMRIALFWMWASAVTACGLHSEQEVPAIPKIQETSAAIGVTAEAIQEAATTRIAEIDAEVGSRPAAGNDGQAVEAQTTGNSTAQITLALMARGDSKAEDPVPDNRFSPNDTIHLVVTVSAAHRGTKVRAVWYAVRVQGLGSRVIGEVTATCEKLEEILDFSLQKPLGTWPPGGYKVELYLDDRLEQAVSFQVKEG